MTGRGLQGVIQGGGEGGREGGGKGNSDVRNLQGLTSLPISECRGRYWSCLASHTVLF